MAMQNMLFKILIHSQCAVNMHVNTQLVNNKNWSLYLHVKLPYFFFFIFDLLSCFNDLKKNSKRFVTKAQVNVLFNVKILRFDIT